MTTSNVTLKVKADMTEFNRQVRAARRSLLMYRLAALLVPVISFGIGFVAGLSIVTTVTRHG
jgi:hypothetical protein